LEKAPYTSKEISSIEISVMAVAASISQVVAGSISLAVEGSVSLAVAGSISQIVLGCSMTPPNVASECVVACVWLALLKQELKQNKTRTHRKMVGLVIALRPQTPKHIRGGWSQTKKITRF
jgi:hypothetical protein